MSGSRGHAVPPTRRPLTVVTWNAGQGSLFASAHAPAADASLSGLARCLVVWSADVVCLQEVRSQGQVDVLCERLGAGWHGQVTRRQGVDREVAVLTRLPRSSTEYFEIETLAGRSALRLGLHHGDHPGVHVIACHASPTSSALRRTYFEQVLGVAEDLPPSDLVLLAGDFNVDPWLAWFSPGDWAILRRLRSRWERVLAGRRTTCMGLLHLDHAFVRNAGGRPAAAEVVKGTREHGRDHDPIRIGIDVDFAPGLGGQLAEAQR